MYTKNRSILSFGSFIKGVCIALTLLFPMLALGQMASTGTVRGVVINEATGAHLYGARVILQASQQSVRYSTLSEADGSFRIPSVAPGDYTIVVTYVGLDEAREQISLGAGSVIERQIALRSDIYQMEAFTVSGEREGSALAITMQREAANVKNVVASDTYGPLIDGNVGMLLQRLPGVAATLISGDARNVMIRGIAADLNSVTVNGTRIPSASASSATRVFEFENVSADSFEMIEVTKSPTPDMDADSIGGSVNLVSKTAFSYKGRRIRAGLGMTHNPVSDTFHPTGNLNYSDIFGQNDQFGLSFNFGFSQHMVANKGTIQQWGGTEQVGFPRQISINENRTLRTRYNNGIKLDWKQSEDSMFGVNLLYNFFNEKNDPTQHAFVVQTPEGGVVPGFTDDIIEWRQFNNTLANMTVSSSTKTGRTWQIQPSGKQTLGSLTLDYDGSYASSRQRFKRSTGDSAGDVTFQIRNIGIRVDRSESIQLPRVTQTAGANMYDISNYAFSGNYVEAEKIGQDTIYGGQFNAKYLFDIAVPAYVKAGLRYRSQERMIDWYGEGVWAYSGPASELINLTKPWKDRDPTGVYQIPSVWPDNRKVAASVRNDPHLWTENRYQSAIRNLRNDGKVNEKVAAGYAMGNVQIANLAILGGVRVERTEIEAEGALRDVSALTIADPWERGQAEWGQKVKSGGNYRNVFPGLHFVHRTSRGIVSRLSYSSGIGRPAFRALMPTSEANYDTMVLSINNTSLKPQYADNFDAGIEYYFEPVGLLSANVFLKEISNFIYNTTGAIIGSGPDNGFEGQYAGWELRSQANGGFARARGFELNYQQQLTFLPGVLRGLGIFANYTRLDTQGNFGGTELVETGAVPGFVPETYNAGVTYSERRWNGRVQWTHRGPYLFSWSANPTARRYHRDMDVVDVNIQYALTRNFEVYFNVNNLFDHPTRREYFLREDRPRNSIWSGPRYAAGVYARF